MGKISRKIKAVVKLRKRKKKQLVLQKEEKAVLKVLQSMQVGDIEKVTLQGHTFLARRHPEGFEYSTNTELMEMIDKVGKAFDKVVPKFESENDFEVWRKTLPSWGAAEPETFEAPSKELVEIWGSNLVPETSQITKNLPLAKEPYLLDEMKEIDELDNKGIVKYGEPVPIKEVTPLPPGVAEAVVDQKTYDTWMKIVREEIGTRLGLKWGQDINASVQILGGGKIKVQWKAFTPKGEVFLTKLGESLSRAQLPEPKPQLPGPTNEISDLH